MESSAFPCIGRGWVHFIRWQDTKQKGETTPWILQKLNP